MRRLQNELKKKKLAVKDPPSPKKKKRKEKFSRWELEELMGVRMSTYTRKNGAIRSK